MVSPGIPPRLPCSPAAWAFLPQHQLGPQLATPSLRDQGLQRAGCALWVLEACPLPQPGQTLPGLPVKWIVAGQAWLPVGAAYRPAACVSWLHTCSRALAMQDRAGRTEPGDRAPPSCPGHLPSGPGPGHPAVSQTQILPHLRHRQAWWFFLLDIWKLCPRLCALAPAQPQHLPPGQLPMVSLFPSLSPRGRPASQVSPQRAGRPSAVQLLTDPQIPPHSGPGDLSVAPSCP